jgi:hypothetical protein
MKTSSFEISWDNPHAIRISRGGYRKKGKGGQTTYEDLWPPQELLDRWNAAKKAGASNDLEPEYTRIYNAQLAELSAQKVYNDLIALAGPDAVLLCFEDPGKFCHRRLVAKWLEDNLEIEVPELRIE